MTGKKWLFLLPLGGILTALCLIFPKVGLLQWLAMIPMLLWLFAVISRDEKISFGRLYGAGTLYFLSFYLTVYHWFFYLYPMEFAGLARGEAAALVVICWLGLSLLQTVASAFTFPLFGLLARVRVMRAHPWLSPFLFAALYTIFEWAQTFTWMGVPWARLPLGQMENGFLLGSAALFGSYFITFALVAVNGLLAFSLLRLDRARLCLVAAAAVFAINAIAGAVGFALDRTDAGEPLKVAAVQGNIGSSGKWSEENNLQVLEVYEKYTAEAAAAGADVVVFPETFLPYDFDTVSLYVVGLAVKYRVTVMCGALLCRDGKVYNGLFTVYPDGSVEETVYAKRHLVPFGEYLPWRSVIKTLIPPLADLNIRAEDLSPGEGSAVIRAPFGSVGGLICFDSIYESLTLDSVRDGAEILVLVTNDSWFSDSAAVYMHSAQARLRAIESGRWIVRSADTGISSVIDPRGATHAELPPLTEGVSIATAYVGGARTLYSYIGNAFVYLLLSAVAALPVTEAILFFRKRGNAPR